MHSTRKVTDDLIYVGGSDRRLSRFENLFPIPRGVSYNSYVLLDDKTVLMDTADESISRQYIENVVHALDGRPLDYMIVQHMEPDHCAMIDAVMSRYPEAKMVCTAKAAQMFAQFYDLDVSDRTLVVKEGDKLSTGEHTLHFVLAPMVHWPEVMVTYDEKDKILFSADAFGKFGALDREEDWACEARRYYFGIVGKYGVQAQALLKKAAALDISVICPLHGPVLKENLSYYINLYNIWSSYGVESEGVVICYTSVYGNTKKAAELLKDELEALGCKKTVLTDLARSDMAEAVEDAFRYGKLVLATTTYNGDIFPFMRQFIDCLTERNFKNRTVGFIENGSWAPVAARVMRGMLEKSKDITYADTLVTVKSALNEESRSAIKQLAKELCN